MIGLHGSGFSFWGLRVLATSTRETKVFILFIIYITCFNVLSLARVHLFLFASSVD
jgi:hypothetical protein